MMDRIYMDNAATTAICPEALAAMLPCFGEHFGNASSIHGAGGTPARCWRTPAARLRTF